MQRKTSRILPNYLREKELLERLPLSSSTLWRLVSKGLFPAPIKLSAGVTVWSESAVASFMEALEDRAKK
ncbi:MAG: helix-turn-helix transcriptional regulator [Betaproteobacteria bacterium]